MVADTRLVCGEGTLWHEGEQKLYWLDIPNGSIYRYDPREGSHERVYAGEVIGGFTVQADGSLLLFMAKGAVRIWKQGQLTTVIEEIPEEREARFNDVIADPEGRVFCGTLSTPPRGVRAACTAWSGTGKSPGCWRASAYPMGWDSPRTANGCTTPTRPRARSTCSITSAAAGPSATSGCSSGFRPARGSRTG